MSSVDSGNQLRLVSAAVVNFESLLGLTKEALVSLFVHRGEQIMAHDASYHSLIVDLNLQLHWFALSWDVSVDDPYLGDRVLLCLHIDLDANTCREREQPLEACRLALHLHPRCCRLAIASNPQDSGWYK